MQQHWMFLEEKFVTWILLFYTMVTAGHVPYNLEAYKSVSMLGFIRARD